MKYQYFYQTSENENREGWIKARSREAAYTALRKSGIRPYRIVGDDPPNWRPWAAAGAVVVLAAVLAAAVALSDDSRRPSPRGQISDDSGVIAAAAVVGWTNVLDTALDRHLAHYAMPGRPVRRRPSSTDAEIDGFAAALETPVRYVRGERDEFRCLKNVLARMRLDMTAYLGEGGTVRDYLAFLDERQEQESEFREKAIEAVYRMPESMRYRAWLGVNARLRDMGIAPLDRPNGLTADDE